MKRKFIQVILPLMIAVLLLVAVFAFITPLVTDAPEGMVAMNEVLVAEESPGPLIVADISSATSGTLLDVNIAWLSLTAAGALSLIYLQHRRCQDSTGSTRDYFTTAPVAYPLKFPSPA